MTTSHPDSFHSSSTLTSGTTTVSYFRLKALTESGAKVNLTRLPYSLRILLENLMRHEDGRTVTADDIKFLASWDAKAEPSREIDDGGNAREILHQNARRHVGDLPRRLRLRVPRR